MQQYVARPGLLTATVESLAEVPVVALLGARQVGKTTLAEQVMSSWPGTATLFDLEVATTREALSRTPERVLGQCEGLVVIDEVQRLPSLFEVLRPLSDDRNREAVFLPPWFENLGKRIVKSPKVYLRDSGILHFLLGLERQQELAVHPRYGASWEGFALEQTLLAHGSRQAYFYATRRGAELDLMLLRRGRRWGFEFKCTDAPRTTKSMHIVIEDLGLTHLWVLYPGDHEYPLTDTITALPLKNVGAVCSRWSRA